jgi:hypothetical protein
VDHHSHLLPFPSLTLLSMYRVLTLILFCVWIHCTEVI